jgi:AraC family transcriptional regulator of adaptative response/methylated-DNA-[protein]-cysteine methyltransferase
MTGSMDTNAKLNLFLMHSTLVMDYLGVQPNRLKFQKLSQLISEQGSGGSDPFYVALFLQQKMENMMPHTLQNMVTSDQVSHGQANLGLSSTHSKVRHVQSNQTNKDYERIATAIRYIVDNSLDQPELSDVAKATGLSEFHCQRLFTRWVGVSPKKFLQYLTLQYAKESLAQSTNVLDAAFDAGLSGPGRLHDLFVNLESVTPGEYKSRGEGLTFRYATHNTRFGDCLTVETERGLTGLSFVGAGGIDAALEEQTAGWENANWVADHTAGIDVVNNALTDSTDKPKESSVSLLLRGSAYQVQVWEALLRIPSGATATYGEMSEKAGFGRKAARAFGNACGANRIGVLIPCHRVIRETGVVSGYRWGTERKHAVLAYEAAQSDHDVQAAV